MDDRRKKIYKIKTNRTLHTDQISGHLWVSAKDEQNLRIFEREILLDLLRHKGSLVRTHVSYGEFKAA